MKAYLQHMETGRFLKNSETWVEGFEDALQFESAVSAIEFYSAHKIQDSQKVRVILRFDGDPRFDITLPLS